MHISDSNGDVSNLVKGFISQFFSCREYIELKVAKLKAWLFFFSIKRCYVPD